MTFLKNFVREESGQDMIEYVLILGFVAVCAAGLITAVSGDIRNIWAVSSNHVVNASTAATTSAS